MCRAASKTRAVAAAATDQRAALGKIAGLVVVKVTFCMRFSLEIIKNEE
jgi:hypothetical protein